MRKLKYVKLFEEMNAEVLTTRKDLEFQKNQYEGITDKLKYVNPELTLELMPWVSETVADDLSKVAQKFMDVVSKNEEFAELKKKIDNTPGGPYNIGVAMGLYLSQLQPLRR